MTDVRSYLSLVTDRLVDTLRAYGYRLWANVLALVRARAVRARGPILLLTTAFPPATWGGVFRPRSFARQLAASGHSVVVITQSGPDGARHGTGPVLERRADGIEVLRLPSGRLKALSPPFPSTDGNLADAYYNVLVAIRHFRARTAPSAVVASGPEFDNFTAARLISKHFDIPLILDYRDEWSDTPFGFVRKGTSDIRFERLALDAASLAVFVTVSTLQRNVDTFGEITRRTVIPNGVDDSIFTNAAVRRSGTSAGESIMRICYVGSFEAHVDPEAFLLTVRAACLSSEEFRERTRFDVTGRIDRKVKHLVRRLELDDVIRFHDPVPHERIPAVLANADAHLILYPPLMERSLPGKFFEYMATDRPIWVVGSTGEVPSVVRETNCGIISAWADSDEMIEAARFLRENRRRSFASEARSDYARGHTRKRSAERLTQEVERLLSAPSDER